jgi:hypothetical protein
MDRELGAEKAKSWRESGHLPCQADSITGKTGVYDIEWGVPVHWERFKVGDLQQLKLRAESEGGEGDDAALQRHIDENPLFAPSALSRFAAQSSRAPPTDLSTEATLPSAPSGAAITAVVPAVSAVPPSAAPVAPASVLGDRIRAQKAAAAALAPASLAFTAARAKEIKTEPETPAQKMAARIAFIKANLVQQQAKYQQMNNDAKLLKQSIEDSMSKDPFAAPFLERTITQVKQTARVTQIIGRMIGEPIVCEKHLPKLVKEMDDCARDDVVLKSHGTKTGYLVAPSAAGKRKRKQPDE